MKKVFDYKFNSENMKKNILQKYDSKKVNSVKVLKLVMPVLLITLTVLAITNNKPNTIIMNNDTLVFNKDLINTGKVDGVILDIDGKSVNTDIISNHDFLKDIKIPESYLLSNQFAIYEKEDEIYNRYYNEEADELLEGKNDDDYRAECNKFHDNVKFVLIENEFGIDKKTYEILEQIFDTSFTDYYIMKTKLYT